MSKICPTAKKDINHVWVFDDRYFRLPERMHQSGDSEGTSWKSSMDMQHVLTLKGSFRGNRSNVTRA
eukprot:5217632-Amphidinium_carterae.1